MDEECWNVNSLNLQLSILYNCMQSSYHYTDFMMLELTVHLWKCNAVFHNPTDYCHL